MQGGVNDALDHIQRGIDFIETHLFERPSLAAIARHAGASPWHFHRSSPRSRARRLPPISGSASSRARASGSSRRRRRSSRIPELWERFARGPMDGVPHRRGTHTFGICADADPGAAEPTSEVPGQPASS